MSTFRKPIAGEPANLILSQGFQSALVDVVNAFNRGELTKKPQELRKQSTVFVKNTSGVTIQPGQAVSVDQDAPTVDSSMLVSYLHTPLVYGAAVSWHGNIGQLAIASETIINNQSGPCQVNGWGRVKADASGIGEWLMVDPTMPQQFLRATGGIARVITADAVSGEVVADFRDQQPLWRYELLTDVVNLSASAYLLDLNGAVYGTITLRFLRNDEKAGDVGQCLHTGNYFDAIEDEQPTPRFRFRLKTSFDDTGQATAKVLDTWGTVRNPDGSIVALGDILTVNDPRKLFAHAIGSDDLAAVHAAANAFFPAGGSVGYAVETEQLKADPADPDDPQYPRWEVEQCTQIIDKMIVQIQGGEGAESTDKPTGEIGEVNVVLKFMPDTAILSRWPDVDYCAEWIPPAEPTDPWRIETRNPNRFSAGTGWAIIERRESRSRAEDAENVDTPYLPNLPGIPEWHITEVENPIARWLCASYVGGSEEEELWASPSDYFEGENPLLVNYFDSGPQLNAAIQTAACLSVDCLKVGERGVAFWDPNLQKYNIVSTNSSLYGTAVDIEAIAQHSDDVTGPLLDFVGCDLNYMKLTPVKVFGLNIDCPATKTTETASPDLVTVDVITGSYRSGDDLCFTKSQVYVCSSVPIDPECVYVCCDDEYGCCEYPPGTFTPDVSQTSCTASGGTWTPGPCPVPCMVECTHCSSGGAKFTFVGISWDAASSTSGLPGNAVVASATWTAGSGDCCMTLTVDFTNGVTTTTHSAEVCIQPGSGCPMASLELNLVWTAATFDGVTLPTTLGGGMIMDCTGSYGEASGCVVPANPGALGAGNWDEAAIDVADCSMT
jgi:hypothetical protein